MDKQEVAKVALILDNCTIARKLDFSQLSNPAYQQTKVLG
jgi:hypothetical protein